LRKKGRFSQDFWADDSPVPPSPGRRLSFRGDDALEHVRPIPARPKVLIDEALDDSGLAGVGHARENAQLFQASFLRCVYYNRIDLSHLEYEAAVTETACRIQFWNGKQFCD